MGMRVGARPARLRARVEAKARMRVSASSLRRRVRRVCGPMLSPRANHRRLRLSLRLMMMMMCVCRSSGRGDCRLR